MKCPPHDWETRTKVARVCLKCGAIAIDTRYPVMISDAQAKALGFSERNGLGLLEETTTWTFIFLYH